MRRSRPINQANALYEQEFSELVESPPPGITVELADESDLYNWKVYMKGPEGSPYQVRCPYPKLPTWSQ